MSSPLPEPKSEFTASLRVVKPTEPTGSSRPAPIERGPSKGFAIGWDIFRITVWATIAVWAYPHFLDYVGGRDIARWLIHHNWVRWLAAPPLGLLAIVSAFELLNDPRKRGSRDKLAQSMGATVVELRHIDPNYGLPTGPGLRVPLGRWSMVVGTWSNKHNARTVAKVIVETQSAFSFVARGADREPAVMRGLQQLTVGHAMRQMADRTDDPRAALAAATLAYLSEPPMSIGNDALDRAVVLRANHPDTARALLTASAVASAITALNEKTRRWDWTFYPTATAGMAEMRLEVPGALSDVESLKLVQALMQTALEHLATAGVLLG